MSNPVTIRRSQQSDQEWILKVLVEEWGGPLVERTGDFIDATQLDAVVAIFDEEPVGLATLLHTLGETEIVTINSFEKGKSIGSQLLEWIETEAQSRGSKVVRIFTSNDNLDALRFYQRRGFRLERVWKDSITEARKIKTTIPLLGSYGISICDEIELSKVIS